MVGIEDARAIAATLPRSYEVLVRGRVKFRVGQYVYVSFSKDHSEMGFAFPKDQRDGLVAGEPDKFFMPTKADLRYHWVMVRLAELDHDELHELVVDAWRMVVPRSVAASYQDPRLDPPAAQ
jgi:hypothetical protein